MDILLTFSGNRDPFNQEIIKGAVTDGPVLGNVKRKLTTCDNPILTTPEHV